MSTSTHLLCSALLGAALVSSTGSAKATLIDFNAVNNLSSSQTLSTYSEGGFTLTTSGFSGPAELFWQRSSSFNADPDGATLSTGFQAITTTLAKNGGGSFIFNSLDLADIYNNKGSGSKGGDVRFTFTRSDLTTEVQTVTIDSLPGLETFTFDISDLISVAWLPLTTNGRWLQVDDIVVDETVAAAVPEPTSLALLSAGLIGVGLMRRRKAA